MEPEVSSVDFDDDRHFNELMPIAAYCYCEIESAKDAATSPGLDTEERALLASRLLTLMNFTEQVPVAVARGPWGRLREDTERHQEQVNAMIAPGLPFGEAMSAGADASARLPPIRVAKILTTTPSRVTNSNPRLGPMTDEDALQFRELFPVFNRIAGTDPAFRFALSAADDWRHAVDIRAAIARLWSGIEAIVQTSAETTFRIAAYAASLLHERGSERRACADTLRRLYRTRSEVVHGKAMEDHELKAELDESFDVLRRLLLKVVRYGRVPSTKEFEEMLFE